MIVVDASLTAAWLLDESGFVPVEDLLNVLASEEIVVPAHWPTELGNALRKAVRMRRLDPATVSPLLTRLDGLDISVAAAVPSTAISGLIHFALDAQVSVYDAAYLRLAIETESSIATLDRALHFAAKKLGVRVIPTALSR